MAEGGSPVHKKPQNNSTDGAAARTGVPSDIELLDLSHEISTFWMNLGVRLGLNTDVLQNIRDNNVQFPNPQAKALEMLFGWRNRQTTFSYMALSNALQQEKRLDLAQKYCGSQQSTDGLHGGKESGHQDASMGQPTTSAEDPLVREAAAALKKRYKTREADINPLPWNEDWQLSLDEVYTKLQMATKERARSNEETEDYCDMHEIFKPHKECRNEKPRVVLVEGKPGIGKTTFSQKLTYDWSRGKIKTSESFPDFDFLFKLKCRDFRKERSTAVADMLQKAIGELLPSDRPELRNALFGYMKKTSSRVLMLLDGLDELPQEIDLYPLIKGEIFSNLHLLLTSRDNKKLRKYCDSLYQIIGFTVEDAKSYIRQFFEKKPNIGQVLLQRLEDDDDLLRELIHSPLNTTLLCAVCQESNGELPSHTTQLYQQIIWCILIIYYKKKEQEPPVDPVETHKEDLAALGRLAFEGLQNDRLHFTEDDFHAEDRAMRILDFGFLSKETSASILNPRSSYQFLHKTMQEYFAALCLCEQLLSGNEACLKYLSQGDSYVYKYRQVAIFVVGILSQKAEVGKLCVRVISYVIDSVSKYDDYDSFYFICELIEEYVSDDRDELFEVVISRFTWKKLDLITRGDENSVEYRLVCCALKENCPLEGLYLLFNKITDVELLVQSMQANSNLKYLCLYGNPILTDFSSLCRVLCNNTTLQLLNLPKKFHDKSALKELRRQNPRLKITFEPPLFPWDLDMFS